MAVTQWQLGEIHTVLWKLASLIPHGWQKGYWPMCSMYFYIQTGSNCVVFIGDNVHHPFVISGWEGLHYLKRDVNDFFCVIFFSRWLSSCSFRKAWHPLPLYWAHPHTRTLGSSFQANYCLCVHVGEVCGEDIIENGLFHVCMSRLPRAKMSHLALSAIWGRIPNSQWKYFTKKTFLLFKLEVIYILEEVCTTCSSHSGLFWLIFFWDRLLMCQPDLKLIFFYLCLLTAGITGVHHPRWVIVESFL